MEAVAKAGRREAARRLVRQPVSWAFAALFALGTLWFWTGRAANGRATSQLSADARYYYVYLPSLLLDGDLDFANDYQKLGNYYHEVVSPETGRLENAFGIGPALFHAPLFLIGHAAALATAHHDGASQLEQQVTMYGSFLYGFAALLLAYFAARRRVDSFAAAAGAIGVMVGGPMLWYTVRQPGYAHPVACATAAALVLVWDATRRQRTLRGWLACGALVGAAALARPQNLTWGVLLVADVGVSLWQLGRTWRASGRAPWRELGASLIGPAAAAGAALVVLAPQLIAWKLLYGSFLTVPQGDSFMRWGDSRWSETLFSSRNGLFPWAPVLVLAAAGLVVLVRRERRVGLTLLAGLALTAYVNGAVWDWWAGGSFGGRRYDGAMPAFALGLAVGIDALRAFAERHLRWVVPAVIGSVLAGILALNCEQARQRDAWSVYQGAQSMRGHYAGLLAGIEGRIYDAVGNPLSFPASVLFGLWHHVPPSRYDEVVGAYFLNDEYLKPTRPGYKREDALLPGSLEHARFLGRGWGPRRLAGRGGSASGAPLVAASATMLVPINQPGALDLVLEGTGPLGARVSLEWNDRGRAGAAVVNTTGRFLVVTQVPADAVVRGVNEATVHAEPYAGVVVERLWMAPPGEVLHRPVAPAPAGH